MRLLDRTPTSETHAKVEDGKLFVSTRIHNDHVIANNLAHRNAKTLRQGAHVPVLPDGNELIYHLQVDPEEWSRFRRSHHDLVKDLHSRNQIDRERAAARIAALHPEWVSSSPRIFSAPGRNLLEAS